MTEAPQHDPAKARFFIINVTRLGGVAFVIIGILITTGRLWAEGIGPDRNLAGYPLIAFGLFSAFVSPAILIRKWRTPK